MFDDGQLEGVESDLNQLRMVVHIGHDGKMEEMGECL